METETIEINSVYDFCLVFWYLLHLVGRSVVSLLPPCRPCYTTYTCSVQRCSMWWKKCQSETGDMRRWAFDSWPGGVKQWRIMLQFFKYATVGPRYGKEVQWLQWSLKVSHCSSVLFTYYLLFGPWGILMLFPGDLGTLKAAQVPHISRQGTHFEIVAAAGFAAAFVPTWSQTDLVFRDWWIWQTDRRLDMSTMFAKWVWWLQWQRRVDVEVPGPAIPGFWKPSPAQIVISFAFGIFGFSALSFLRDADHQTRATWDIQLSSKELLWFCSKQLGYFFAVETFPRFSCHCHLLIPFAFWTGSACHLKAKANNILHQMEW